MSKKRSLGSSPIGYKSDDSSMGFIPDLGVSKKKKSSPGVSPGNDKSSSAQQDSETQSAPEKKKKSKKKIVSYNLEVELISKVKSIAKSKDMYYSSLVSVALKNWLADNG